MRTLVLVMTLAGVADADSLPMQAPPPPASLEIDLSKVTLQQTPAVPTDPKLVQLRDKLALDFHEGWPQAKAELEVTLSDGRVLKASHDAGIPSSDIAAQRKRLVAKFDALA